MGISREIMAGLLEEAAFKPFTGTAVTLGRQTMGATAEIALAMFAQAGVKPAITDTRLDLSTKFAVENKLQTIFDVDFFRMLGFSEVLAMDISDFEGAEIVHDLNQPIPASLESRFDFLIDGSTLDNIFNPNVGLTNISRLLRPGGRCILSNRGNFTPGFGGVPYTIFNPLWFFDYFVWNNYKDVRIYVIVYGLDEHGARTYTLSHDHAAQKSSVRPIASLNDPISIVVFAEKGENSTYDRMPVQDAYRPEEQSNKISRRVLAFKEIGRPHLISGRDGPEIPHVAAGWIRVLPRGATAAKSEAVSA